MHNTKMGHKCGHIIEWVQTYNERPSYTITHKGSNMRPNTRKLFKFDYNYQSLTEAQALYFNGKQSASEKCSCVYFSIAAYVLVTTLTCTKWDNILVHS